MEAIKKLHVNIFPPEKQGSGSFDNGKITEIKPIDFPGGTSESKRIGPLFYWSWATAKGDGVISMHPHKAFEIVSYVLGGTVGHSDSLKNKTRVGPGGAQLIQAGSGIYHQEEMYGDVTDFFQIWFEPDVRETINHDPNYIQIEHEQFPVKEENGVTIKNVIGNNSPLQIVADINAHDILIGESGSYSRKIKSGNGLAFSVINGPGKFNCGEDEWKLMSKDFTILKAEEDMELIFTPEAGSNLRLFAIEMPSAVDYPLYGED